MVAALPCSMDMVAVQSESCKKRRQQSTKCGKGSGNAATEVLAATLPCRIVMAVHRVKVAARKRNNDQLEIAMVAKVAAASTVEACSLVATLPCSIVMAVVQQKWLQKRSYNQLG